MSGAARIGRMLDQLTEARTKCKKLEQRAQDDKEELIQARKAKQDISGAQGLLPGDKIGGWPGIITRAQEARDAAKNWRMRCLESEEQHRAATETVKDLAVKYREAKNRIASLERELADAPTFDTIVEETVTKLRAQVAQLEETIGRMRGGASEQGARAGVFERLLHERDTLLLQERDTLLLQGEPSAPLQLKVRKLHPDAILPTRATDGSAGWDLYAQNDFGFSKGGRHLHDMRIAVEIPLGYVGQICPRSGVAWEYGVTVLNAPGVIDCDYRGELKALLINHGHMVEFKRGDRIAQLLIVPAPRVELVEVLELSPTARGAGGLGSTGA